MAISHTNFHKPDKVNKTTIETMKNNAGVQPRRLNKLHSKIQSIADKNTHYIHPNSIKNMFEEVKLAKGVKLLEDGKVKRENKFQNTFYSNNKLNLTKNEYKKMWFKKEG